MIVIIFNLIEFSGDELCPNEKCTLWCVSSLQIAAKLPISAGNKHIMDSSKLFQDSLCSFIDLSNAVINQ